MHRLTFGVALAFAVSGATTGVDGQEIVRPGSVVRLGLVNGAGPIEGVVSSVTPDTWTVTGPGGQIERISSTDVSSAEIQVARRNTLRGMLVGGGMGLVGGLLVVATADDNCDQDATGICDAFAGIAGRAALLWAPVAGAALGAVVGTLVTSRDWVPAIVPTGLGGRVGFAWSVQADLP